MATGSPRLDLRADLGVIAEGHQVANPDPPEVDGALGLGCGGRS